jgi:hypothetical protein
MCKKMTAHWRDRQNWTEEKHKTGWGREDKKEIWDGVRCAELPYFWDPNKLWMLPVRCPIAGCGSVILALEIQWSPAWEFGNKRLITCPTCCNDFEYYPNIVRGDPRNITYIGHWDGWQPFDQPFHGCGNLILYLI